MENLVVSVLNVNKIQFFVSLIGVFILHLPQSYLHEDNLNKKNF